MSAPEPDGGERAIRALILLMGLAILCGAIFVVGGFGK